VFLLALPVAWWLVGRIGEDSLSEEHAWERHAVVGAWTEEGGEPGNLIRLALKESGSYWGGAVKTMNGKATFVKQFGLNQSEPVPWNYENFYPLRLNVVLSGHGQFLAVSFADRDHARMRLVSAIEEASKLDVLAHPSARNFRRVEP
jgi:hypothetical protein